MVLGDTPKLRGVLAANARSHGCQRTANKWEPQARRCGSGRDGDPHKFAQQNAQGDSAVRAYGYRALVVRLTCRATGSHAWLALSA